MLKRISLSALAGLALAACATNVPDQPDFASGMWDGEPLVPPPGLLTAHQGTLMGAMIDNRAGPTPLVVKYELVDPSTAAPRYVVVSNRGYRDYIIMPLSAIHVGAGAAWTSVTEYSLSSLPQYDSVAALESHYPRTIVTTPVVVQPATPGAPMTAMLPPVVPAAPATTSGMLALAHTGSVIGYPVVDSIGQPVGQVASVAVVPTTGEVRYAIVSGPSFGIGNYIAVPVSETRMGAGRVVLNGPLASWTQAPRYRGEQLPQALGVMGSLN